MIADTYNQSTENLSEEQIKALEKRNKLEQKALMLEEIKNRKRLTLLKKDYLEYLKATNKDFKVGKHIEYIARKIPEFMNQSEKTYLIITLPPQHGKSMSITEAYPSFYLINNMEDRVIIASYNERYATRFGKKNKDKLRDCCEAYNFELDKDSALEFSIKDHLGTCISRGIMSGITGSPADLIIVDDPIKNRKEAESKNRRDTLYAEWLDTLNTRLSAKGKMIIILTRWHEDDLAGKIMNTLPQLCEIINIPCEAEDNDILGREKGEPLFPEIGKDQKWLERFKTIYAQKEGQRSWFSLYQGRPSIEGGNYIKRKCFKYYTKDTLPTKMDVVCISVDATFKDKENNDDVSIQVWGKHRCNYYLLDKSSGKMSFTKTVQMIAIMKNKWYETSRIYIEDKANGPAIINVLQDLIEGIIPVEPDGSKTSRLLSVTGIIESGNVYLPQDAEWLEDYISQLTKFPAVEHDDDVDSTSQALSKLMFIIEPITITLTENIQLQDPYKFNGKSVNNNIGNILTGKVTESFLNYK